MSFKINKNGKTYEGGFIPKNYPASNIKMVNGESVEGALSYTLKHAHFLAEITSQFISNGYFFTSSSNILTLAGVSSFSKVKNVIVGIHQSSGIQALIANGLPSITVDYLFIPISTTIETGTYMFDVTLVCEA